MRDKAYWREAARFDPDSLTLDEFLTFTHPESSASNQLALVDELYEKFDRDGDEFLTEDEFSTTNINDGTSPLLLFHQSELERRKEFQNSIDLNKDGKADRRELLRYVAPQNPRRSELEAQTLISLADIDHNDALNLSEVLARPDLFMASKMVDTGRSFHDEF
ncbi:45 kDa calcium-binding protein-like [Chrysoperla carnea]|uniref:45 kDa calcium-binding protein-like n=1 Tax=Chrysoperla carnea TaxID=189513 RepID=UPI001D07CBAD|nr:45 kDa calcium-binding protein-like [Chrysoperla carnea]